MEFRGVKSVGLFFSYIGVLTFKDTKNGGVLFDFINKAPPFSGRGWESNFLDVIDK
jgi:hypothetical protein